MRFSAPIFFENVPIIQNAPLFVTISKQGGILNKNPSDVLRWSRPKAGFQREQTAKSMCRAQNRFKDGAAARMSTSSEKICELKSLKWTIAMSD